jgi:cytochrome b561
MLQSKWNGPALFLHGALAIGVTAQLILSLIMGHGHHTLLEKTAFFCHIYVGFTMLATVAAHWCWTFYDDIGIAGLPHLFPWGKQGRGAVFQDIKDLVCQRKLPTKGARPGLPGLVHGLGLLLITSMAISGATMFMTFGVPSYATITSVTKYWHCAMANVVWVYWFGHVGLAFLHRFSDKSIQK